MVNSVFLKPGDWFFGKGHGQIITILGSCVSLVLWHAKSQTIGMSHILLPQRQQGMRSSSPMPCAADGKYADELLSIFSRELWRSGLYWQDCQISLFGGGDMFATRVNCLSIGEKNLAMIQAFAQQQQLGFAMQDIGGTVYRRLHVTMHNGAIQCESSSVKHFNQTVGRRAHLKPSTQGRPLKAVS